jgi:hypothetical protein
MIRGRVLALCGLLAVVGCAGHATTMEDVRAALLKNDLEGARARLAEAGRGTDDLLFALEDGLLLHVAGDPSLSNSRFEFAELRIDDLYTKSISRTALSLIASDSWRRSSSSAASRVTPNISIHPFSTTWPEWVWNPMSQTTRTSRCVWQRPLTKREAIRRRPN